MDQLVGGRERTRSRLNSSCDSGGSPAVLNDDPDGPVKCFLPLPVGPDFSIEGVISTVAQLT